MNQTNCVSYLSVILFPHPAHSWEPLVCGSALTSMVMVRRQTPHTATHRKPAATNQRTDINKQLAQVSLADVIISCVCVCERAGARVQPTHLLKLASSEAAGGRRRQGNIFIDCAAAFLIKKITTQSARGAHMCTHQPSLSSK